MTALLIAAKQGHLKVVALLLQPGCSGWHAGNEGQLYTLLLVEALAVWMW